MPPGPAVVAVEAIPIAIPPDAAADGSPDAAPPRGLRRQQRGLVYSPWGESLFVRLTTEDGATGWGETLASVAPEVATAVVRSLLAPQLIGRDPMAVEALWADRGVAGG